MMQTVFHRHPHASLTRRKLQHLMLGGTLLTCLPFLARTSQAADRTQLGTVDKMHPLAGATYEKDTHLLGIGDKVYQDDRLWTRDQGQIHVALLDGSNLSIGENAEVTLDASMVGAIGLTATFMRVIRGAFRFNSGNGEKPANPPRIDTPFAIISLRGTEVFGGRLDKGYSIFVIDGEIDVTNDGGSVTLKAGEGTMLTGRDEAPTPPKVWPEAKVKRAKAMLRF